jgi:hypothetical protein
MTCGPFSRDLIPADKIKGVLHRLKTNKPPPTNVVSTQNPDGTFKVTADFPPCPEPKKPKAAEPG